jgi:formylglycine-generating enzyme required for sulfatase activity
MIQTACVFLIGALLCARGLGVAGESPEMLRIPAGPFWMGDDHGPADEKPRHQLNVAEFFIDRTKVTNAQFARFMNARGVQAADGQRWYDADDNDARIRRHGAQWTAHPGHENHPVVEVSWYGALAYCRWLGKKLPTEAEWEKAARGTDGRRFPWGNAATDKNRAHFAGGWNELKPVGSFPQGASPYGVLDMAGNGWEWVSSAYLPYPYDGSDGREDLSRDLVRGTRGGGHDARPEELASTRRGRHVSRNPRSGHHNISFRCTR